MGPASESQHDGRHPRVILYGASVRAAAQSARRAGLAVHGIDLFGDTDARAACERFHRLNDALQLSAAVAQAQEAWAKAPVVRVGDMGDALDDEFPKSQTDFASSAGVDEWVTPQTDAPVEEQSARWLTKPRNGTGGLGIRWSDASGTDPAQGEHFRQRWIAGRAHGFSFLASEDRVDFLGACRAITKRIGDQPFIYGGSIGPVAIDASDRESLHRFAEGQAFSTGYRGLMNVDAILRPGRPPCVLEVNRRWSASMELIERSHACGSLSLIKAHLDAINGMPTMWPWNGSPDRRYANHERYVKRIVYSRHDGSICGYRLESLRRHDHLGGAVEFADLPQPDSPIGQGWPLMTVVMRAHARGHAGRDLRMAVRAAQQIVTTA